MTDGNARQSLRQRLARLGATLKREIRFYRHIMRHPKTPWLAYAFLAAALGYLAMPFDLIPDFIPIIGHLDDALIVPGLIALAIRLVPSDVIDECRRAVANANPGETRHG